MTRYVLAPGLRVLDRGRRQIQIGIDPARALRLSPTEDLRRTLDHLDRGEVPPTTRGVRRALAALAPVLVDADRLAPDGIEPGDAASTAVVDPAGFADRLAARRTRSVRVLGELGPDPRPLLTAAGLRITTGSNADAILVLSHGEPDRALLDRLIRDDLSHLVVRSIEGQLVVGPLVVPGASACVRCIDAHLATVDPLHPALASIHHRAGRHDGVPEPLDSALATLAIGWAVRDLVSHLDGDPAATWSSTLRLGPDLTGFGLVQWLRHPECGCSWPGDALGSATMMA